MFHYSSSALLSVLYLVVANVVVIHTLVLHNNRNKPDLSSMEGETKNEEPMVALKAETVLAGGAVNVVDAATSVIVATESNNANNSQPKAGCTLEVSDGVAPNVPINTWGNTDYRHFKLRIGPNYDRNKQKAPSGPPLYEVFAVDAFCTDKRIDNVTSRMELPDTSDLEIANPHVPPIFVVQVQMPSQPPSVFRSVEDGPGWALVLYFKMTQETCNQLKDLSTASAGVKLFATWCEKAPTDPAWKARFKVLLPPPPTPTPHTHTNTHNYHHPSFFFLFFEYLNHHFGI